MFDRVVDIAGEVKQYMRLMDMAPFLNAEGLDESYKLLADFDGAVLAGHPTKHGIQFVTWEWNFDRSGVWGGRYYCGSFETAKRDFALRAGLIDRDMLFSSEQLTEVYHSIHETLDGEYAITDKRRNLLESAAEQIERSVPDLEQRVNQSNQQELEMNIESGQTMY